MRKIINISIAGLGYVGLSLALLLSKYYKVSAVDINQKRIDDLNDGIIPISDLGNLDDSLVDKNNIVFTTDPAEGYKDADYVVVAVSTDFSETLGCFDTKHVDDVVKAVTEVNKRAVIVIKSTVPIGLTKSLSDKYPSRTFLFSPEFLRETKCVEDTVNPSRIVVGHNGNEDKAKEFASILLSLSYKKDAPILLTGLSEAESIKLFSNTYLAMRVAFFNELDTFAVSNNLNVKDIIKGVCLDNRIGDFYNNPSFGYGGYCLPKDSKQLRASYRNLPGTLINGIVSSNDERKRFIASLVEKRLKEFNLSKKDAVVGIYRLSMKSGSSNYRASSILDVALLLKENGYSVCIYEPTIKNKDINGIKIVNKEDVLEKATVILTNRASADLTSLKSKVITEDIFSRD